MKRRRREFMSDNETFYYVRSTKFCLFYMYVYLFYTFIILTLFDMGGP